MNIPQEGIKLHRGNFSAIDVLLQPYLANGDTY
ncbi:DNA base-flipping protein [Klebsiella grimontii]|nr:DNA base-flipping protein [Klebsiella grimontii]MBZ7373925.1 DNA base-flipping protein [Klebsiella grimontii]